MKREEMSRTKERKMKNKDKDKDKDKGKEVMVKGNVMDNMDERYCKVDEDQEVELTVHKTSRFSHGDGFLVYSSTGNILLRVDSYGPLRLHSKHHLPLLLMNAFGMPLLTLLPKRLTLHNRWDGFIGEKLDGRDQRPLFSVWKSTIIGRSSVMVQVYSDPPVEYQIEGSFSERRCTISRVINQDDNNQSRLVVAHIRRKMDPTRSIMFGKDVFSLIIKAGFDDAFAVALVMALDGIEGDDVVCSSCHSFFGA